MTAKRLLKSMFGRLGIVSFSILIQILFLTSILVFLSSQAFIIYVLLQLCSVFAVLYIVGKNENPSFKIPWIIMILVLPLVGGISYMLWGNKRIPKSLQKRLEEYYYNELASFAIGEDPTIDLKNTDLSLYKQCEYIKRTSGFPVWQNTACEFFPLGDDKLPRMLQELEKAQHFIFLEYFIIEQGIMWNSILDVLKMKMEQGVKVYLMYDDMGTISTLPVGYDEYLSSLGIHVTVFNPYTPHLNMAMNYRDHRKICVIDGNVGFCGGANLADEYINKVNIHGHWKDTAVMLQGDGVWNLTTLFITLWNFSNAEDPLKFYEYVPTISCQTDGYVQPFGDSPLDNVNVGQGAYLNMINMATDYIYVTTPYLIIDHETMTAFINAAQSGIDVRIITPYIGDKWFVHMTTRSYYRPLIEAGVKIYEYRPGFIHSKQCVSDDKVAIVGTINMDFRSLYLHFECGVSFYKSSIVDAVRQDIINTLEVCHQVTLEDTIVYNPFKRLIVAILKVFAPLM